MSLEATDASLIHRRSGYPWRVAPQQRSLPFNQTTKSYSTKNERTRHLLNARVMPQKTSGVWGLAPIEFKASNTSLIYVGSGLRSVDTFRPAADGMLHLIQVIWLIRSMLRETSDQVGSNHHATRSCRSAAQYVKFMSKRELRGRAQRGHPQRAQRESSEGTPTKLRGDTHNLPYVRQHQWHKTTTRFPECMDWAAELDSLAQRGHP